MPNMTFSAQKGEGNLEHNFDLEYRRKHSERVNPNIANIVLKHEDVEVVYDHLFSKALDEYNAKQKRNDRKIKSYYERILNSKKQKPFYEIILTTGNMSDGIDEQTKIDMLKELYQEFIKTYKNLYVFGAVIHLDEEGSPHLHIDYIPFVDKENCKKGLSRSVNQDEAYKAMGFKPEKSFINGEDKAPIIFNGFRNDLCRKAEAIYKSHKIDILHVKAGKEHQTIPDFKDSKAYDDLIAKQEQKIQIYANVKIEQTRTIRAITTIKTKQGEMVAYTDYQKLERLANELTKDKTDLINQNRALQAQKEALEVDYSVNQVKELRNQIKGLQAEIRGYKPQLKELAEYKSIYKQFIKGLNSMGKEFRDKVMTWFSAPAQKVIKKHLEDAKQQTSALGGIKSKGTITQRDPHAKAKVKEQELG